MAASPLVGVAVGRKTKISGGMKSSVGVFVTVAVGVGSVKTVAVGARAVDRSGRGGTALFGAAMTGSLLENNEKGLGILEHATMERPKTRASIAMESRRPCDLRRGFVARGSVITIGITNLISSGSRS